MEKHKFVTEIPDSYKATLLNHGVNGTCYRTSDGDVFKEYFVNGVYDNITEMLLDIKCDGFAMPKQLIFRGNGLSKPTSVDYIGLRKDYVEGIRIGDITEETNMENLLTAISWFESRMCEMSYGYEVDLYDLNTGNLIFNEKESTLTDIDTDVIQPFSVWYRQPDNPYYENMKLFAADIGYKLFFPHKYQDFVLEDYKMLCSLYGRARVSDLIKASIVEMRKQGQNVETYGDYQKGLMLIKK